jgi:hypothetical protein
VFNSNGSCGCELLLLSAVVIEPLWLDRFKRGTPASCPPAGWTFTTTRLACTKASLHEVANQPVSGSCPIFETKYYNLSTRTIMIELFYLLLMGGDAVATGVPFQQYLGPLGGGSVIHHERRRHVHC